MLAGMSAWCAALSGCSSNAKSIPAPFHYTDGIERPILNVDPSLRTKNVEVPYLSGRRPENGFAELR